MSSNYISRKTDTVQLSLKHFLGKFLHFKGEENLLDIQAKRSSPFEDGKEKLGQPYLMTEGNEAMSTNLQLLQIELLYILENTLKEYITVIC